MEDVIVNEMTTFRGKTVYSGSFFGLLFCRYIFFFFFFDNNYTYYEFSLPHFYVETLTTVDGEQGSETTLRNKNVNKFQGTINHKNHKLLVYGSQCH